MLGVCPHSARENRLNKQHKSINVLLFIYDPNDFQFPIFQSNSNRFTKLFQSLGNCTAEERVFILILRLSMLRSNCLLSKYGRRAFSACCTAACWRVRLQPSVSPPKKIQPPGNVEKEKEKKCGGGLKQIFK